MLQSLANIFKIPDLKKKIFFTLFIVIVHRIGCHIPTPFIDLDAINEFWKGQVSGRGILMMIDMFSGRAFRRMTVLALGIMPYISASIILQLLMVVWPRLEKIAKEGEAGRKKINQYTRYGTVMLSAFQSMGIALLILQQGWTPLAEHHKLLFIFITMVSMTTGTTFLMWLGEKISEKGIGNGISLIIAIGIAASYPYDIGIGMENIRVGNLRPIWFPVLFATMVAVSVAIIYIQEGSRKIPVQHAKRVVGRRMMSGSTTYLPLKVNTAGVIPVIFSSAILSFPGLIFSWLGTGNQGILYDLGQWFDINSRQNPYYWLGLTKGGIFYLLKVLNVYTLLYALLTIFFCYFYTAITFNPTDTAENLKKYGAFIPGRRPGKPTSDYIDFVLTRITLVGSIFLVAVALLPNVFYVSFQIPWALTDFVGGTGLIIVIGVLLDTMKQVESHLLMRHYEGFKLRTRGRGRW
jgi:preprotein translocase subunit SecY